MTIAEQLIEEGFRKGFQEGLEEAKRELHEEGLREGYEEGLREGHEEGLREGQREGQIDALRRVLVCKFKLTTLDPACEACLQAAAPEALDRYVERVLTADSLAAVFAD